jgi:hypothetical protein
LGISCNTEGGAKESLFISTWLSILGQKCHGENGGDSGELVGVIVSRKCLALIIYRDGRGFEMGNELQEQP